MRRSAFMRSDGRLMARVNVDEPGGPFAGPIQPPSSGTSRRLFDRGHRGEALPLPSRAARPLIEPQRRDLGERYLARSMRVADGAEDRRPDHGVERVELRVLDVAVAVLPRATEAAIDDSLACSGDRHVGERKPSERMRSGWGLLGRALPKSSRFALRGPRVSGNGVR